MRRIALAASFMTVLLSPARADEQTEFTFHAGKSNINLGKSSPGGASSVSGSSFGVRYLHSVTGFTSLGLDIDFLRSGRVSSTKVVANGESVFSVESSSVLGVIRCGTTEETIRPNFLFGLGIHATSLRLDSKPQPGFGWADTGTTEKRALIDSTGLGPAVKIQGGADYAFNDNFLAGGYLAFNYLGSATYDTTDQAKALGVNTTKGTMLAISGGINLSARF